MQKYSDLIDAELGSRHPGNTIIKVVYLVAFLWSIFQLWVASPIQYSVAAIPGFDWLIFNSSKVRSIHLAVAILLAFLLFPLSHAKKWSARIPLYDWLFALVGSFAALYIYLFYNTIALRIGIPTQYDIIIALAGMVLLFEASRRVLGPAISIIACIFLFYSYYGPFFPSILAHKGSSISGIVSYQWLSSEGVFGTALGVSADFVFLYVLFGAFLEKAGAGNFFIQLSFALLGRFTGGPAKAAVVASGLMGMISGSSIANTITVGSFTIPLMKKMGLSPEKAGAIEVSAGINGQIMPPVMGAAAFIMAEYLSVPYTEIIKHAFLPAILVYIALLYIVHLEAKKLNLHALKAEAQPFILYRILRFAIITTSIFLTFGIIYFIIYGIQHLNLPGLYDIFQENTIYPISLIIGVIYVIILKYQSQFPDLEEDNDQIKLKLPLVTDILRTGIHFFIPVVILIWSLMIERLSPALSAYWTIMFLIVTLITQHSIKSIFRGEKDKVIPYLKQGFSDFIGAMILGARNMISVAIATATAGIIVGTVSLTGIGLSLGGIVDYLAGGDLFITLIITSIICIILGMGMPTTACYIIVSTLMVPVLIYATNKNGIIVPPVALHLFVLYFGLMADVTPPVGLASYAAAAIAKANTLKTSTQAFLYNMRTMALPFIFVFNPELLLYNIKSISALIILLISSIAGIFTISAATQGYFLVKSKLHESLLLLLIGLSLLYPQAWINVFYQQFDVIPIERMEGVEYKEDANLRVSVLSKNITNEVEKKMVLFNSLPDNDIKNKLSAAGIIKLQQGNDNKIIIKEIKLGSKADKAQLYVGDTILSIETSVNQPNKNLVFIPIAATLAMVILIQRRRLHAC